MLAAMSRLSIAALIFTRVMVVASLRDNGAAVPRRDEAAPRAVGGHYEDVARFQPEFSGGALRVVLVEAERAQRRVQHYPVGYYDERRVGVLRLYAEVGARGSVRSLPPHHGHTTRSLDDGELYLREVENLAASERHHQVIDGEAEVAHSLAVNFAAADDYFRAARDEPPHRGESQAQPRHRDLEADEGEYRRYADDDGDIDVLEGEGRDVGDEDSDDELGGLELPELALAHEPHREYDEHIQNKRTYQNYRHFNSSFGVSMARGEKNMYRR